MPPVTRRSSTPSVADEADAAGEADADALDDETLELEPDDVVMSGMAGQVPGCRDLSEFCDALFTKRDLATRTADLWGDEHADIPPFVGKVSRWEEFDWAFFGVSEAAAAGMDPQARRLLTCAYEAVVDAGVNPFTLRGSRTAVVLGYSFNEAEKFLLYDPALPNERRECVFERATLAQFISSWLGLTGPSFAVDTACASTLYALDKALAAIQAGECDAAIVGSATLHLMPALTAHFYRLGVLSRRGRSSCFDELGDGYLRSETVGAIFLQRARDARRAYACVVHAASNADGHKQEGITFPSRAGQATLLRRVYSHPAVDAAKLTYFEAHCTGTKVGDPEELSALEQVLFNEGRRKATLPLGAVKGSVGHSEPASGFCSLTKAALMAHTGRIPPATHYSSPRKSVPGFWNGRFRVVTETEPLVPGLLGVNNFGFGGANAHAVLRVGAPRRRRSRRRDAPRLVPAAARTEEGARGMLAAAAAAPADVDFHLLLQGLCGAPAPGMDYRGFVVVGGIAAPTIHIQRWDEERAPEVWLVFPRDEGRGRGRWARAAESLQRLPPFADALQRCDALRRDAFDAALDAESTDASNAPDALEALAAVAVQVGLVAALKAVGITFAGALSQGGVGVLACAHARGCLSAEAALLLAYAAGEVRASKGRLCLLQRFKELLREVRPRACCGGQLCSPEALASALSPWVTYREEGLSEPLELPEGAIAVEVQPWPSAEGAPKGARFALALGGGGLDAAEEMLYAIGRLFLEGVDPHMWALAPAVPLPVGAGAPLLSPLVRWAGTEVPLPGHGASGGPCCARVTLAATAEDCRAMAGHVIDGRPLIPATGYLHMVWKVFAASQQIIFNWLPVVFEKVHFLRATHLPKDNGKVELQVVIHRTTGAFEVSEGAALVVQGFVRQMTKAEREALRPPSLPDAPDPLDLTSRDVYKALRLRGYDYTGAYRGILGISPDGVRGQVRWAGDWVAFLDCLLQLSVLGDSSSALVVPVSIERIAVDPLKHEGFLPRRVVLDEAYGDEGDSQDVLTVAAAEVDRELGAVRAGGVEVRGLQASIIARRKPAGDPVLERYDFTPYFLDVEGEVEDAWATAVRAAAQVALEGRRPPVVRGAAPLKAVELVASGTKAPLLTPALLAALEDMPLVQAKATIIMDNGASLPEGSELPSGTAVRADAEDEEPEGEAAFVLGVGLSPVGRLARAARLLAPGGCVLSQEVTQVPLSALEGTAARMGLSVVMRWTRSKKAFVVFQKGGWEVDESTAAVVHVRDEEAFAWLPTLQAALAGACRPEQRVFLVAQGDPLSGAQGLFNCLRQEPGPGRDQLRLYFLPEGGEPFSLRSRLFRRQAARDLAVNVLERGQWGSMRHLPLPAAPAAPSAHAICDVAVVGDLSSFTWFQGGIDMVRVPQVPDKVAIHVYYSALNFKDVMLATGKLNAANVRGSSGSHLLGVEVSGRSMDGRRVVAVVDGGGISTVASVRTCLALPVPDEWTLEQAATVPAVYLTALYALETRGRIRRGETVLVHAGSGGVGQAAIHLCLFFGCRVLTTVGTSDKKNFLLKMFPQLAAEDVGNSRDCSFEALVLRRTAGRGVDLVLNSLAGDKLLASLRCLAPGGRFLEIGKADMQADSALVLSLLRGGRSFHGILLDKLWAEAADDQLAAFTARLGELIGAGAVKPLPVHSFPRERVEEAFRFMATGKHMGKVIIQMRPEEQDRNSIPRSLMVEARRRFHCQPDMSYVICGGLGGFGLELGEWLAARGARHLVLTSRRGVATGYQSRRLLLWRRRGLQATVFTGDAATPEGADALLRAAAAAAPVAAVFNLAVVLRDGLFENQTAEAYEEAYRCKASATKCLDAASRRLCPRLQHFVVFSSVSCGRGNAGQSNYGLANSVMERVVRARREAGLPGTAVQWGAVGDVGLVADMLDDDRQLEIGGTLTQRLSSCLEVLDGFLSQPHAVVASMVVAEKKVAGGDSDVVALVANIFGIRDLKTISPESTLAELGMDSMMAVEVQQAMERNCDVILTVSEVRGLSFARIKEMQDAKRREEENSEGGEQQSGPRAAEGKKREAPGDPGSGWTLALSQLLPHLERVVPGSSAELVPLPSLPSSGADDTLTLLLPGVEGEPSLLAPLASRLRGPVASVRLSATARRRPLGSFVDDIMPVIRGAVGNGKSFQLVGHSFGGLLAVEAARRLEQDSAGPRAVVLLDASPPAIHRLFLKELPKGYKGELRSVPDDLFEREFAARLAAVVQPQTPQDTVRASLSACSSWELRLAAAVAGAGVEARGVLVAAADALASRLLALRDYTWPPEEPLQRLKCRLALVRPAAEDSALDDDALVLLGERRPVVRVVDGVNHYTIVNSTAAASYIDELLHNEGSTTSL